MTFILVFNGSSGAQALAELHRRADPFGPPVVGVDAVAHEEHGETLRKRRASFSAAGRGPKAGTTRATAGHRDADAAQDRSAIDESH